MILKTLARLLKFRKAESGSVTVEFVMIFPAFLFFILSAVEYSLVTLQQAMLERAVDQSVRDIRLGTGTGMTHDQIKDSICNKAIMVRECDQNLRLEMIIQNAFVGVDLPPEPDCTDNSEEVKPVRQFKQGQSNELMILRACAKIDPVFPTSSMGRALSDETGQIALTATTAFVQEP